MTQVDLWTIVYSVTFSAGAIGSAIWFIARKAISHVIEEHIDIMREELVDFNAKLNRIEYALYNDGKTGLINKVDCLIERQQGIKIDVEVLKSKGL